MSDFDHEFSWQHYRPILEDLLFADPTRGSIVQIGPTRSSMIYPNGILGREFVKRLYQQGNSAGKAFMLAMRNVLMKYPEYTDRFRTFVYLGDPLIGSETVTGVGGVAARRGAWLDSPRPNPFNPRTTLIVQTDRPGRAVLEVYDVQGRRVKTLLKSKLVGAGGTRVVWDGTNDPGNKVGSGIYWVRLKMNGAKSTQKLVLLK